MFSPILGVNTIWYHCSSMPLLDSMRMAGTKNFVCCVSCFNRFGVPKPEVHMPSPVVYQANLGTTAYGRFRDVEPPRVHTRMILVGIFS